MEEYEREKMNFLQKVFVDRKYLEQITALSEYQLLDDQLDVSQAYLNLVFFFCKCLYVSA